MSNSYALSSVKKTELTELCTRILNIDIQSYGHDKNNQKDCRPVVF